MKKRIRNLFALFVLLALFASSVSALENQRSDVSITVIDNGRSAGYVTDATTLSEFFNKEEIEIGPFDIVEPPLEAVPGNGMAVTITRYVQITVKIYNRELYSQFNPIVRAGTVLSAIQQYSEQTGKQYAYDYPLAGHDQVTSGTPLELRPIMVSENVTTSPIPYETETVFSEEYPEGVEFILTEGAEGLFKTVETVTYTGGYETSCEITFNGVAVYPVNAVKVIGTAKNNPTPAPVLLNELPLVESPLELPTGPFVPEEEEPGEVMGAAFVQELTPVIDGLSFAYAKEFTMSATAYTCDYASTGKKPGDKWFGITASGLKAQVGVIAVDPSVIPLGTKLYVEGYGFAIAGDTGKSIKGNKIDLFFNTAAEVKNFGRQSRKVFVLTDQDFVIALN